VLRQAARVVLPRASHHGPFALAHRGQVHRYRTNTHAVLRAAARLVGEARAGDHRLGRGAPPVDADAAQVVTLDQRHLLTRLCQLDGQEPAALAGPYHDRVVVLIGHCVSSSCRGYRECSDEVPRARSRSTITATLPSTPWPAFSDCSPELIASAVLSMVWPMCGTTSPCAAHSIARAIPRWRKARASLSSVAGSEK